MSFRIPCGLAVTAVCAHMVLFTIGCGREAVVTARRTASRQVSFQHEVQPIFTKRCTACHQPGAYEDGTAMGALVLSEGKSASQLIGFRSIESKLPRVAPGDLENSYLHHKLRGTFTKVGGTGVQMPLGTQLPEEEIVVIEEWILGGAKTD